MPVYKEEYPLACAAMAAMYGHSPDVFDFWDLLTEDGDEFLIQVEQGIRKALSDEAWKRDERAMEVSDE
jgi:hypothetical protein